MPNNVFGAAPLSSIGLGCSRVGSFNNATPMAEVRATLQAALDLGVTVFDTADVYGQGDSERELGRALRGRRQEAFVVTKLGRRFPAKLRALRMVKPVVRALLPSRTAQRAISARRAEVIALDFAPERFPAAIDGSLRRLGFDAVDGLLLHSPPIAVVRDPAVGAALAALQSAGKVRAFGISCDDCACLEAALMVPRLTLLQVTLPVLDEAIQRGLGPKIRANGVTVFAREVIQLRAAQSVREAVTAACARTDVDCVIVGASRRAHLRDLAAAMPT